MIDRGDASPRSRPFRCFATAMSAALLCSVMRLSATGLTSPEPLTKAYNLILDARFDEAHRQLQQACPPAPRPACEVLEAVADYWQILLDHENTSRDAKLITKINASIGSTEGWVSREP